MSNKLKKEDAVKVMKKIKDPELDLDIWTLGLIYNIDIRGNKIDVKMTFTSPMCPYGPQILYEVEENLKREGFKEPNVEVVFDPPWHPTEELREMLGV